jgi:cytochrome c2
MSRVLLSTLLACAMLSAGAATAADGDAQRGKKVFRKCAACHSLTPGKNKIGPSLNGVLERKSGTAPKYRYSTAMKSAGVIWTEENLDKYLAAPKKFVPKNKMPFPGLKKARDRKDVIAYLKTATK